MRIEFERPAAMRAASGTRSHDRLRAITFLAPGIPLGFFDAVTRYLSAAVGGEIDLVAETRSSGPMHGDADPFAEGRADLGFLCSPSYLFLRAQPTPSIRLVPAGFVFRDPRHGGDPVYYSEVVVRAEHPARDFRDLAGERWGYNDECSLSGHFATLQRLRELGRAADFFGDYVRTGSHHASLDATLAGAIDGAAIDSVVLGMQLRERPELAGRIRVLTTWGPFPIQPVVVRRDLDPQLAARITGALLALGGPPSAVPEALSAFGLERCVPIDDSIYAEERRALCALGQLDA